MIEKGTIAPCFVRAAVQGMVDQGLDPDPLLRKAGIDPDAVRSGTSRIPPSAYSAMLKLVAQVLDDELFGQDSRRMKVGSFAMLCRLVIHAPTLEKALTLICRFFGLVLDDVVITLARGAGAGRGERLARLELATPFLGRPRHVFGMEALLTFIHGLACWLVRRRIAIVQADFSYPMPDYASEYTVLYSSRVRFQQPVTALAFDAALLALPVRQTERTLKTFLAEAPENMLVKYKNITSEAGRVRRVLRRLPPTDWPGFDEMAAHLGVPASTLRRHLQRDGTSYQQIKDDLRHHLALLWLAEGSRGVADVAADLGFAEPSAFHRAFRKWTGSRPGVYRRQGRGVGP